MDQATSQIVGIVLIGAGIMDPVIGFLVIGPRIPDPGKRQMVTMALVTSGLMMIGLGIAFLTGAFA